MSVDSMLFNLSKYDWTRIVPDTITIPKGTKTVMLQTNNGDNTYGYLENHEANFQKQITTKVISYYKKYELFKPEGVDKSWNDVYVIHAKVTDLWDNDYDFVFTGLVSAKDVISGGVKLLYRLCSKAYRTFRRAVIL